MILDERQVATYDAHMKRGVLETVRDALSNSALSRYEVARRAGVDQGALSRFMHGGSLRIESVEKLCTVLGLKLTVTRDQRRKP